MLHTYNCISTVYILGLAWYLWDKEQTLLHMSHTALFVSSSSIHDSSDLCCTLQYSTTNRKFIFHLDSHIKINLFIILPTHHYLLGVLNNI